MTEPVVVKRDNNVDLKFNGVLLSGTSSRRPGQDRWTDLSLYRTDNGKYVIVSIGRSVVPGERDRNSAYLVDTAAGVRKSLLRYGKTGPYLTRQALALLETAGKVDLSFNDLTETV